MINDKGTTSRNKFVRVKTAKGRKKSSTAWLQRQLNDPYVIRAQKEGYRSRAAYKLMEINVFSPGGLGSAQKFEKVNFSHVVIDALERKVQYMGYYRRNFDNDEMATL